MYSIWANLGKIIVHRVYCISLFVKTDLVIQTYVCFDLLRGEIKNQSQELHVVIFVRVEKPLKPSSAHSGSKGTPLNSGLMKVL